MELAKLYGVDALRYFLLRDVSFGNDGTFSDEAIVTRANADLSNSFGNLAQRTLAFIAKNCEGHVPEGRSEEADAVLLAEVDVACAAFQTAFDDLALSLGLETWMTGVFACNQYIDAQAPWTLRKTDPDRMRAVLRTLIRAIRRLADTIVPVIPGSASRLLAQLPSEDDEEYRVAAPSPIFPRLELQQSEGA
jgi:methionyl-tRNA synthetase